MIGSRSGAPLRSRRRERRRRAWRAGRCLAAGCVAVFALAAAPPALAQVSEPAPSSAAARDLALERTPAIVRHFYEQLPPIGPGGRMGANRKGGFSLAHQMYGDLYVRAGIMRDEPALIEQGFTAFDFAFRRQRANGSFPADQAEEYAFFVEAVAHSVLLLRNSPYEATYDARLDRYARRLARAARHMVAPAAWTAFRERNRHYTHSAYVMGTALGMTGRLTGRRTLIRKGRRAAALGLSRQRRNGVNPELGGYDVRYQVAGLAWAERYAIYFPGGRVGERTSAMIGRGLRWMWRRVDPDGWIDWYGSTRACRELGSNGKPKTPGYGYAIRGFAYWGAHTGRDGLLAKADRAKAYLDGVPRASVLCGPKVAPEEPAPDSAQATESERSRPAPSGGPALLDLYE